MRPCWLFGFCIFLLAGGYYFSSAVHAGDNFLGLDDSSGYDVYVRQGYGDTVILRNVDIVGLKEIDGVVWLEVQLDSFSSRRSKGLIRFSEVTLILPAHRSLPVHSTGKHHH